MPIGSLAKGGGNVALTGSSVDTPTPLTEGPPVVGRAELVLVVEVFPVDEVAAVNTSGGLVG